MVQAEREKQKTGRRIGTSETNVPKKARGLLNERVGLNRKIVKVIGGRVTEGETNAGGGGSTGGPEKGLLESPKKTRR